MTEAREADLEKLWLAGRSMTMDDSLNFATNPAIARLPLSTFATSGLFAACKAAQSQADVPRVKHGMQIVDLDSSSVIFKRITGNTMLLAI